MKRIGKNKQLVLLLLLLALATTTTAVAANPVSDTADGSLAGETWQRLAAYFAEPACGSSTAEARLDERGVSSLIPDCWLAAD